MPGQPCVERELVSPSQRAFGCASVHFGTVPGPVHLTDAPAAAWLGEDLVWLMTVRLEGSEPYRVPELILAGDPKPARQLSLTAS